MKLLGLSWRIGVPFLLLVLSMTLTLALYMRGQIVARQTQQLERLASANATFIGQTSLPRSERLASELTLVTGCDVYFRKADRLTPLPVDKSLAEALRKVIADGKAKPVESMDGAMEAVLVRMQDDSELAFVRRPSHEWFDPRIVQVVATFWLLAILLAFVVVRGLVRPLRNLAMQVQNLELPQPLTLPEVHRRDEIGDVARAMAHTHQTLHEERERRARMEKLAVLGRMTTSLAHEIRNPIAAIKMHAQLSAKTTPSSATDVIEREANRIEALVNQWMYLSRPEPPALSRMDIGELLDEVLHSHEAQLHHAEVSVALTKQGELATSCDRQRLDHVFRNLITNAVQAMPSGGDLRISATRRDETLEVAFLDSGPGFSSQAQERHAEYFFSEKEGGMGIGLSVASEIMTAHGGNLQIANQPGAGAKVTLSLPLSEQA